MLELLTEHLTAAERDRARAVRDHHRGRQGLCSGARPPGRRRRDWHRRREAAGWGGGVGLGNTRDLSTVVLQEMDTPVIAAINGAAAGYGLDLALGCDIRLIGASAKLLPGFAKRGVVPGIGRHGTCPGWSAGRRPARSGSSGATSTPPSPIARPGQPVVDDDDLLTTARSWAGEIAANAPLAVQAIRAAATGTGRPRTSPRHTHHVPLQVDGHVRNQATSPRALRPSWRSDSLSSRSVAACTAPNLRVDPVHPPVLEAHRRPRRPAWC